MAIGFRQALETDFDTATNVWNVVAPNEALVGDYLLALLASPGTGVIWSSPGWKQLDAFSTVNFTLAAALPPVAIPISYALFAHFLEADDTGSYVFPVQGAPTAVIGSQPGQAAGVALMAAYTGINRSQPTRKIAIQSTPELQISYGYGAGATSVFPGSAIGPVQNESLPPLTPVTSAPVPAIFGETNDWLVAPLIAPAGSNLTLPGPNFILRAGTTGGLGIAIALADELVTQTMLQSGLAWGGSSISTPCLTEAIGLWPDASTLENRTIEFFATLGREPAHYDYQYSQEPRFICNEAGYLIKVYAGARERARSLFSSVVLNAANLLVTRSDGSTFTVPLTFAPDGTYAYCVSALNWFPYTGRYTFQLQMIWGNGSQEYSSQMYDYAQAQGGQ